MTNFSMYKIFNKFGMELLAEPLVHLKCFFFCFLFFVLFCLLYWSAHGWYKGATIFFGIEGGVMNFRRYLANIFVTPPFDDQKFYDLPSRATRLKKHVTLMHVAWKICILGAISCNKIFIKICRQPIIWFFWDPHFSWKNSVIPQLFHGPPYSEENDSPLKSAVHRLKSFAQDAAQAGWALAQGVPRGPEAGADTGFLKRGGAKLRTDRASAPVWTEGVWGGWAPSEVGKNCNFQSHLAQFGAFFLPGAPTQSQAPYLCKK